jgi:hypothetical protein
MIIDRYLLKLFGILNFIQLFVPGMLSQFRAYTSTFYLVLFNRLSKLSGILAFVAFNKLGTLKGGINDLNKHLQRLTFCSRSKLFTEGPTFFLPTIESIILIPNSHKLTL